MNRFATVLCTAIALVMVEPLAQARVNIDIDLTTQTMRVAADGGEAYVWPISSGKAGHLTPTGRYRPQRLYAMIHSLKYDNAPMPHSIFFTGGYAIHGSNAVRALGRPASHGCIRLSPRNAGVLFALVRRQSATIVISGATPAGEVAELPAHPTFGYASRLRSRPLREWTKNPLDL